MTDFIDPDFIYASSSFTKNVYKLKIESHENESNRDDRKLRRIELERGACAGGLFGQPAI